MHETYPIALHGKPQPPPTGAYVEMGPLSFSDEDVQFFGVMLVMPLGAPDLVTGTTPPPKPRQTDVPMGPLAFFDQRAWNWEIDQFN